MPLISLSIRRSPLAVAVAVATLAAAGLLAAPPARAASSGSAARADLPRSSHLPSQAAISALLGKLGARTAGNYLDRSGQLVVTVTDPSAAATVRAAGFQPRLVRHSARQLSRATNTLDASARIPGTAWAVDPELNVVVVSADSTVTGRRLAQLTSVTRRLGDLVRVEHAPGRLAPTLAPAIAGGDAIYGGQYRCSMGFNVVIGTTHYFLTAGHCGNLASTWYGNGNHTSILGSRTGSSFPRNDYAIIKITNSGIGTPGVVDLYNGRTQDIANSGDPKVGERVSRSGSTSHVHSGVVKALNATVNYAEGTVYGLIKTTVCSNSGDSGGPLFDGPKALGLTSGGSGSCFGGGITYFQPVTEPLSVYGAHVY